MTMHMIDILLMDRYTTLVKRIQQEEHNESSDLQHQGAHKGHDMYIRLCNLHLNISPLDLHNFVHNWNIIVKQILNDRFIGEEQLKLN